MLALQEAEQHAAAQVLRAVVERDADRVVEADDVAREPASAPERLVAIYDDVSLEALALRNERPAQDFVTRELGPLLGGDKRTRTLLETLTAYVSSGWSTASAGARLGVHERTIGYRVATVEQRLGRPLAVDQARLIASPPAAGVGSGRRIIRNELNSPSRPARIGTSSAT